MVGASHWMPWMATSSSSTCIDGLDLPTWGRQTLAFFQVPAASGMLTTPSSLWKGKEKAVDRYNSTSSSDKGENVEKAAASAIAASTAPSTSTGSASTKATTAKPPATGAPKPWVHFAAGGVGGMCGAIITSPLDVVKTRLQSDMYLDKAKATKLGKPMGVLGSVRNLAWHFVETGYLLGEISTKEGPKALFKGLGPTLVGVIPARSINFYSYGNGKRILADKFNNGKESSVVHLSAAAIAGIITATATNPIWVVKTRLQLENQVNQQRLDASRKAAVGLHSSGRSTTAGTASVARSGTTFISNPSAASATGDNSRSMTTFFKPRTAPARPSTNSFQMTLLIVRNEGIQGLYKGMSASYLGVAEGTIQWALYERLKGFEKSTISSGSEKRSTLSSTISAAGIAKLVASLITYPHEVVRTRMRQEPEPGQLRKYTGLLQTIKVVVREEGVAALYGGLSAHLLRVVPNAAVMFSIYELFLRLAPREQS